MLEEFREYVQDVHGKQRGKLGDELQNAMIEYMDNDRTARLETDVEAMDEKLDEILARLSQTESGTHAHSQSTTSTDGGEHGTGALSDAEVRSMSQGAKAERIIDYIHDAHLGTALSEAKLRDYCDEIAGVGDRSFDSYRTVFKNKALLYEDPRQDTDYWYLDREQFFAVLRETYAKPLAELKPEDPDDPQPEGRGHDLDVVQEYGGAVAPTYRAYRLVTYLRDNFVEPFDEPHARAAATQFENYVFDQQPNTLDPQTYLDVVRREGYLAVEDGALTLTANVRYKSDDNVEIDV
ncbi:hypothetical protein [Halospeciosus flavus]|uniref:Uncharacterized protein n=1 Tax=Halospeciosus flavus TaxID=3032283 RepID=A0ABD5Z6B5_9EURY|nr:hypothetical protein [Halospeciosus flavus]